MTVSRPERLADRHRLRSGLDYAAVREHGTAHRSRLVLLLALPREGEISRVGFIASRRGVGGAVQRNRARRRLREIVRRRWVRVPPEGFLLVFIASRATLRASHQELATEVEALLTRADALRPVADA